MSLSKWLNIAGDLVTIRDDIYRKQVGRTLPPQDLCLRGFELLSPEQVRVVILGQDPYPTPGKANGLAFGYNREYHGHIDSSLSNIMEELGLDPNVTGDFDRSLESWARQGVLLLNTRLTVRAGQPMSHAGLGWEDAIKSLLNWLLCNQAPLIWLLWGREAAQMARSIGLDLTASNVICTSHPCRFSARTGKQPFLGSNCFNYVNECLRLERQNPIVWERTVEEII